MPRPIITLLSDFGDADGFVGTMKGVILKVCAGYGVEPELVDVAHQIPPGDIRHAAMVLAAATPHFPNGTVHLAVVDPGVGTSRAAIAIATPCATFVGPDNGLLTMATLTSDRTAHRLESTAHRLEPVSHTFHGRDIFAPAAAHLACGVSLATLGPTHPQPIELEWPKPKVERARLGPSRIVASVVYVDRFGNLVTNLTAAALASFAQTRVSVTIGRTRIRGISKTYGALPEPATHAAPVALLNSWGWLEIAVPGDSAAQKLRVGVGEPVIVEEARLVPALEPGAE